MPNNTRNRPYVGTRNGEREVFHSRETPTTTSHGHLYNGVIGPFHTVRGAQFMASHGQGNPHCLTVADAERIAGQQHKGLAEQLGITTVQLAHLVKLIDIAAEAQTEEHNTGKDSTAQVEAVERYVKSLGYGCRWPGLYPILCKDGQEYFLP